MRPLRSLTTATWLLALLGLGTIALLPGCGGVPADSGLKGGIVVFGAFASSDDDAEFIQTSATVVVGGVRGIFNGPSGEALVLRNIPFGSGSDLAQPLTVTAPGYKTLTQQVALRTDAAVYVDVTMEAADTSLTGTVQGLVTDVSGAPLANASVAFSWDDGGATESLKGYTGSDGRYIVGGIAAGEVTVEAVASGYLAEARQATVAADDYGTSADQDFALTAGDTRVTVSGYVADLRTDERLAGATVTVGDLPSVTTGSDGRFSVSGVLVGDRSVTARLEGYDNYDDVIEVSPEMGSLAILMSKASGAPPGTPYTIAGTVDLVGPADDSGATVTAYDRDRLMDMDSTTTDADGHYWLFVPAGRYQITVTMNGHSISRNLTYLGGGRKLEGINFTLSVTP